MIDEAKPMGKSRTFWFNLVSGIGAAVSLAAGAIRPQYAPLVPVLMGAVNIALRKISRQPIKGIVSAD